MIYFNYIFEFKIPLTIAYHSFIKMFWENNYRLKFLKFSAMDNALRLGVHKALANSRKPILKKMLRDKELANKIVDGL